MRRLALAGRTSKAEATEAQSVCPVFLLHKHWNLLLDEIWLREWMWNFDMDGIRFLDVNRDLIRDRHFVRDFHRVGHCLFNRVWDLFLYVYRIRFDYFNRIRLFNLDFNWHLHRIQNFLFHCHWIRFLNWNLHCLVDDDGFELLVGASKAGVRVALGGTVALWPAG